MAARVPEAVRALPGRAADDRVLAERIAGLRAQAEALLPVLNGGPGYDMVFAPAFRQAVPLGQWQALTAQLRDSLGAPQRIATLTPKGRYAAQLLVGYERGTATMLIAIDCASSRGTRADRAWTRLLMTRRSKTLCRRARSGRLSRKA